MRFQRSGWIVSIVFRVTASAWAAYPVEGGVDVVHRGVNQCGGVGEARR